ncbi:MAG TPA: class I SAM-dependent methyltransferase [Gaiellaceae bacterium]|nr:class I SAM-dependent methyltransferase [Gaiellaceae bacterium]
MAGCCRSGACERMFTARFARRTLRRYRKKGLDDVERELVGAALSEGVEGARVLEIGGGIGAIQAELLAAGAASGEIVELVPAYEQYARELASMLGLFGRTEFRVLDLLEEPEAVPPADVVVLNRVVCCSPDGVELTALAARLARRLLLVSYPRDAWWVRAAVGLQNAGLRLLRRSFRVFVHPPDALAAAAGAAGLRLERRGGGAIWEYAVLQRPLELERTS